MKPLLDLDRTYNLEESDYKWVPEYAKIVLNSRRIDRTILYKSILNSGMDFVVDEDSDTINDRLAKSEAILYAIIGTSIINMREVSSSITDKRAPEKLVALASVMLDSERRAEIGAFYSESASFAIDYGFAMGAQPEVGAKIVLRLFVTIFAFLSNYDISSLDTGSLTLGMTTGDMEEINDVTINRINDGGDFIKMILGCR